MASSYQMPIRGVNSDRQSPSSLPLHSRHPSRRDAVNFESPSHASYTRSPMMARWMEESTVESSNIVFARTNGRDNIDGNSQAVSCQASDSWRKGFWNKYPTVPQEYIEHWPDQVSNRGCTTRISSSPSPISSNPVSLLSHIASKASIFESKESVKYPVEASMISSQKDQTKPPAPTVALWEWVSPISARETPWNISYLLIAVKTGTGAQLFGYEGQLQGLGFDRSGLKFFARFNILSFTSYTLVPQRFHGNFDRSDGKKTFGDHSGSNQIQQALGPTDLLRQSTKINLNDNGKRTKGDSNDGGSDDEDPREGDPKKPKPQSDLGCPYCKDKFPTWRKLIDHILRKHIPYLQCDGCYKSYGKHFELARHKRKGKETKRPSCQKWQGVQSRIPPNVVAFAEQVAACKENFTSLYEILFKDGKKRYDHACNINNLGPPTQPVQATLSTISEPREPRGQPYTQQGQDPEEAPHYGRGSTETTEGAESTTQALLVGPYTYSRPPHTSRALGQQIYHKPASINDLKPSQLTEVQEMCPDLLLKIDGLGVQLRALARNAPHLIDSAMVYLEKMVEGVKEKHESSASLRSPPKAVLQNPPKTIIAGRAAIAAEVDLDDSELYLPPPQLVITNKSHGMVELTADSEVDSNDYSLLPQPHALTSQFNEEVELIAASLAEVDSNNRGFYPPLLQQQVFANSSREEAGLDFSGTTETAAATTIASDYSGPDVLAQAQQPRTEVGWYAVKDYNLYNLFGDIGLPGTLGGDMGMPEGDGIV